ncbi:MAG: hypothetical protein IJ561_07680 [Ruminococcus sp.]|nr:hypothetical protein [Ruminococcus sp.]
MFGIFAKRYRINYDSCEGFSKKARKSARAGERVTLYYDVIATDTDYSFFLDGAELNVDWAEDKGYILSFTMPASDVTLKVTSRNTMCISE